MADLGKTLNELFELNEDEKFYKDYFVLEIKTEDDEKLAALTKKKILPVFDESNKVTRISNNDVIFVL